MVIFRTGQRADGLKVIAWFGKSPGGAIFGDHLAFTDRFEHDERRALETILRAQILRTEDEFNFKFSCPDGDETDPIWAKILGES